MNYLMIMNDPPYGTERTYNGLRLALNLLSKTEGMSLTVFLMGDAASAGKAGQQTPNGYYNLERMLKGVLTKKGRVLLFYAEPLPAVRMRHPGWLWHAGKVLFEKQVVWQWL